MNSISAVILTKNNASQIKPLIRQLSFCQEIIVVDDQSQDKTSSIARKLGAQVFTRPLKGDFSKQRNFGLTKATSDWVLFIDPDETVTLKLAQEIQATVTHPLPLSYQLKRQDTFLGKTLRFGETGTLKLTRLGKRQPSAKWHRPVHEIWPLAFPGQLKTPLLHTPHQSITDFLTKINRYTSIEARYRHHQGIRFNLFELLFYPPAKFVYNFIFKVGFLDGFPGLVMAFIMSLHSLIVRIKLYEYEKTPPGAAGHSNRS